MYTSEQNNKRIAKNTIALCFRMFITMGISIYSSRILLENLGVVDYGVYNVVGGIVAMFAILNSTMVNGTQRFLNYELGKGNTDKVNLVFSTSINIHIIIALVILLLGESIGLYLLNTTLEIPDNKIIAANWVLQFTILSAMVNVISMPYNALIISYERMGVFAFVAIVQSVLNLLICILIEYVDAERLIIYAFLMCLLQVLIRVFYGWYCKHHFEDIKYKKHFDVKMFKEMLSFSGWTLTGTVAYMSYTQGLSLLLNTFFGPVVNAAQALSNQVSSALSTFSGNFMTATKPQITKSYAERNFARLHNLILYGSKYSFLIMLMLSLPFFIRTEYILNLWLSQTPDYTVIFLKYCLCISLWQTLATPAVTAIHATGEIRNFQIVESICLIMIFPLSYIVLRCGGHPSYIYTTQLSVLIFTQFVRLYFLKKQLGINVLSYTKMLVSICAVALISTTFTLMVSKFVQQTLLGFVILCIVSSFSTLAFSLIIAMNKNERLYILKTIKQKCIKHG